MTARGGAADVIVIGAGFAGLSAAVRLASAGLRVEVFEQAPRLGGRASAFTDKASGERVDNGQHVLFGCYRETYAFLRAIGAESLAPLQPRLRLPMAGADGRVVALECPRLPPPLHLPAGLLRWRALTVAERFAALRVGRVLRRARRHGMAHVAAEVPESMTVTGWLDQHRQPRRVRDWLWHPLTFAALNQAPDIAAAAPFVRVAAQLFGPALDDSAVGLARVPLDEMYAEPAVRFIERRGGTVHLKTPVGVVVEKDGSVVGVRASGKLVPASAVVSSVPWHAFGDLWEDGIPPAVEPAARAAASLDSSPIVTVNLWLDGPVMNETFVGLVDAPVHWAFDKAAIVGERLSHLAVVTSGADHLVGIDNDEVTRITVEHLSRALPLMRSRTVLRSVVVREHRATFSVAPGGPRRPDAATGLRGFYLAGDWTNTGLPATIEGAVISGHAAAGLILRNRADTPGTAHNHR
jgi:squalene-associated FAD-dependent desaturase